MGVGQKEEWAKGSLWIVILNQGLGMSKLLVKKKTIQRCRRLAVHARIERVNADRFEVIVRNFMQQHTMEFNLASAVLSLKLEAVGWREHLMLSQRTHRVPGTCIWSLIITSRGSAHPQPPQVSAHTCKELQITWAGKMLQQVNRLEIKYR